MNGRGSRAGNVVFAIIVSLIGAAFAFLHLYRMASISPTWDEGTDIGIIHCLAATHDPFACLDDISQTRLPFYISGGARGHAADRSATWLVARQR